MNKDYVLNLTDVADALNSDDNNPLYVKVGESIIKLVPNTLSTDEYEELLSNGTLKQIKKDTTIVTGLWNLGRNALDNGFERSYEHYKQKFAELLKTPSNMFIYVSKEDEEFIWKHRSRQNTLVKVMELEQFDEWFEFFDKVDTIRNKPEWSSQASWLKDSPQAKLKYYNPIVMSKMFLLNNATIFNPFDSEYFYWIDAGITNTVHPGYFFHDRVFDNLSEYTKKTNGFIFISYPYEDGHEIHGFPRTELEKECQTSHVKYVCRGGFFGGEKEKIHNVNSLYYHTLSSTLSSDLMGTEESIFTILSHKHADKFTRFSVDSNGLIWPFFEKLKDLEQLIKEIPKTHISLTTAKNILYILGFNSPQQFESVCKSIVETDMELLSKSRKILINNSNDETLFRDYDNLCELYGFEEIHKDNLGVCGGRQFTAEHFDETDADFYMFFEDDMHLNSLETNDQVCPNGFRKYIPNLYNNVVEIMLKEKLDFLKFSFSEFYGNNSTQWSWYNVPQHVRTQYWPEYDKLPEHGIDENAPKTEFKHISIFNNIPYITGDIYYSNWPQIVSRTGNQKMFLDTKWARPYEQTWMSHMFQLTKQNQLKSAVLLASPVEHKRFEFYEGNLRKES